MSITPKLLKSAALTNTLTTTIATVPAGETWRIFLLRVSVGGTGGALTLSVTDTSTNDTRKIVDAKALAANSNYDDGDIILEPGDVLKGGCTVAADITLFGFVHT